MARDIKYSRILEDEASFQIVRTNPKLTGNLKLTIDGKDNMWLDSISANQELSRDKYKKVAIDPFLSLPANIYRFFDSGLTPPEIVFSLTESFDSTKTSNDYKDQYDFSHYFSGAKYLPSRKYDEKLSYFAPLYLKSKIPDYFVIFKISNPLNKDIQTLIDSFPIDRETYLKEMFKKASILKTFDLRETTKVGKYIRNYVNDSSFPKNPLDVYYSEDQLTNFNGILYNSGVFGSRGEYLSDLYKTANPLKYFEEFITLGYERQGIIFPNILNIDFIFDDDKSKTYDFNRYFGVYINAIELTKLDIDLDRSYSERGIWENTPRFRKNFKEYEQVSIQQSNPAGVEFPVNNLDLNLSDFENIFSDDRNLFFNYITDRDSNLYLPKLDSPYTVEYDNSGNELKSGRIRLADLDIDLGKFFGPGSLFLQDKGSSSNSRGFSHAYIKIDNLDHLDEIKVYHLKGTRSDSNGKYDSIVATSNYNVVPNSGDYYVYNDVDGIAGFDTFYFNSTGLKSEIASALAGCINGIAVKQFKAYAFNEYVFIKFTVAGDFDSTCNLEFVPSDLDFSKLTINGSTGSTLSNSLIPFEGGSRPEGNRLILDSSNLQKVRSNISDLLVKTTKGWSKVLKSSRFIDSITESAAISKNSKDLAVDDFFNKMVITLELDQEPQISNGEFIIRFKHRPGFGLISFFPIKDFDFDFFRSEYLNFPEIDLHQYYFIPEEKSLLVGSEEYEVRGTGSIRINHTDTTLNFTQSIDLSTISVPSAINFSLTPGLGFGTIIGLKVRIKAGSNKYIDGTVGAYNTITGLILVNVTSRVGSSVESNWEIYQVAESGDQFNISSTGSTSYSYSIESGSPFVSYSSSTAATLHTPINDENRELEGFPGFFLIKDPDLVVPETEDRDFELKTKYLNGLANTEYDFYKENYSADFALRSKMIPYISKWSVSEGKDARSNPYRLNTELAFGFNNFAPDHDDRTQNPSNFTHEWYYIESKFNYVLDVNSISSNEYYFETPFDENLCLSDPNYFIDYFTYSPTFNNKEIGKTQTRYSPIRKNSIGEYEAFFKGFKIGFKDYISINQLGPDGKPIPNPNSNRFEGYKFTCLLRAVKEEINEDRQPPISYKFIEHSDFKFIILVIEVSLGSIDLIDRYWSAPSPPLSIDSIITNGPGSNFLLSGPGTSTFVYDSVNGDYRIEFDTVDSMEIGNLNHTLLYSLKNKKFNNYLDRFSNIKISSKLNLNFTGAFTSGNNIEILNNPFIPEYPSKLSDEVINFEDNNLIIARNKILNVDQFLDKTVTFIAQLTNPVEFSFENFISLSTNIDIALIDTSAVPVSFVPSGYPSSYFRDNYTFKQLAGGKRHYESLFDKLSFAAFKDAVNGLDPFIQYSSYSLNGNLVVQSSSPNWYSTVPDISSVTKNSALIADPDSNIPAAISNLGTVSFAYSTVPLDTTYSINRYEGGYSPLFKDLFFFNSKFNFSTSDINSLDSSNTRLNILIDDFMTIDNFNHIKVSDSQILSLENDSIFDPRYEIPGEIAIGRSKYFLLSSNWDYGFHYKYLTKTQKTEVPGTLRIEEDDSFIGKLINLRTEIELEDFQVSEVGSPTGINIDDFEIVYYNTPTSIAGFVNINKVLTRYLISDGITQKFEEFLVDSNQIIGNFDSIESYVKEYIKVNILKLYETLSVEFYTKTDPSLTQSGSVNPVQFVNGLDDKSRFTLGYKLNNNLQINNFDRLVLSFEFNQQVSGGTLISPKIKIKFI
jgi:hypothetical protein